MYRRILFAVDDDDTVTAGVPVVAAYARRSGAYVRVIHVHRIVPGAPASHGRLVSALVERLQSAGVCADGDVHMVEGQETVASVIARVARREGADLVAIGSHGRSDLGALVLGSVSHAVAAGLDVPVLVLRAGCRAEASPRTVLVALDGSDSDGQAVAEAGDVAKRFAATVVVLHVRQIATAESVAVVEPEDEAWAIVERGLADLRVRGITATGETAVELSVVTGIVSAVERHNGDLVVLGSSRPSDLRGLLLGSVAHEAIHQLRCPVLLARRAEVAEASGREVEVEVSPMQQSALGQRRRGVEMASRAADLLYRGTFELRAGLARLGSRVRARSPLQAEPDCASTSPAKTPGGSAAR